MGEAERALDNSLEIKVAQFEPASRPTLWWPHEPGSHAEGYDSTLILNARHETVHRLMEAADREPIDDALRAMHVVGLLLGRAPVSVDQAGCGRRPSPQPYFWWMLAMIAFIGLLTRSLLESLSAIIATSLSP